MVRLKKASKIFFCIVIFLVFLQLFLYFNNTLNFNDFIDKKLKLNVVSKESVLTINKDFKVSNKLIKEKDSRISWENHTQIELDFKRTGPGEQGLPYNLTDPEDIKNNKELFDVEGFYVLVSDRISVERALPDKRPEACKTKKYLRKLPKVSVIITFHNEIFSVLLRCIHSIYNRSPPELLHEILLINDGSTFEEYKKHLGEYLKKFNGKVKLHHNEKREGLIRARMIGAKLAEAEVILFLDSHMEVANSWLPPLLDLLVEHPTYAVVPLVEGMNHATFAYEYIGNGYRGTFDWNFRYQWLPLRPQDKPHLGENYELSSMTGGAYAIRREHFFYLGGYDEKMKIWNGENYELSLKLWLCSGGIIQVPCSRIVHLSKLFASYRASSDGFDFSAYNLKRVAEVWLDDYKKYFYRGDPERYAKIDAGDLSKQFELKKRLNCKPFKYFLDFVAPEMLEKYPLEPQYFAKTSIQNLSSKLCLGLRHLTYHITPILTVCNNELDKPIKGSDFSLTFEKSIKYNDTNDQCFDSKGLKFENCHHQGHTQHWMYLKTSQLYHPFTNKCLAGNQIHEEVFLAPCDDQLLNQKWTFGIFNATALDNWNSTGVIYKI